MGSEMCIRDRCYNDSFGSGTIQSAVRNGFQAYGGARWNEVMKADDTMKTRAVLESTLDQAKLDHLRLSIESANAITSAPPINNATLGGAPVAFNQASNSPPSARMERAAAAGAHTFYKFKSNRECE